MSAFFPVQAQEALDNSDALTADQAKKILFNLAPRDFKQLLGITSGDDIRKLIEPVQANNQCESAGVPFIIGQTKCWICGCTINEGGTNKACEHVIPALRAIMFKGLMTTRQIASGVFDQTPFKEEYQQITKQNYLWAHADCNGSAGKTNMVLITYDEQNRIFVPDDSKCGILAYKINKLNTQSNPRNCYYTPQIYSRTGVKISSPYEVLVTEMDLQCRSMNKEFNFFNGNLSSFCKYSLNRAKLYFTTKGLEAMLSPEEKQQQQQLQEQLQREKLQEEYDTLNEALSLLNEDIKLARDYLTDSLNKLKMGYIGVVSQVSRDKKIYYYKQAIELYLLYFNLEPHENPELIEKIINIIQQVGAMAPVIESVPVEIMLTIIYIFTQLTLFNSTNGHRKLINKNEFLDLNRRMTIITVLDKFYNGRSAQSKIIRDDVLNELFILQNGEPDKNKFYSHLCEYLGIFVVQYIIYLHTHNNSQPNVQSTNIGLDVPLVNNITENDINSIKQQLNTIPSYLDGYYNYVIGLCWEPLRTLIFTTSQYEINSCRETVQNAIMARFTNKGQELPVDNSSEIMEEDVSEYNYNPNQLDPQIQKKILLDNIASWPPNVQQNFFDETNINYERIANINDYNDLNLVTQQILAFKNHNKLFGGKKRKTNKKKNIKKHKEHKKPNKKSIRLIRKRRIQKTRKNV